MTLHSGEWLVLAMMAGMVLYSLWEADKSKLAVIAGRKTKLAMYKETIGFLWLPTSVLLMLLPFNIVSAESLGLTWQNSWANWSGALLVMVGLAMCAGIFAVFGPVLRSTNSYLMLCKPTTG